MADLLIVQARPRASAEYDLKVYSSLRLRTFQRTPKPGPGPGFLAGNFPDGITRIEGEPAPATIRVMLRQAGSGSDGVLVATTQSGLDGSWRIDNLDPALKFDVICRAPGYNDMILANISPKPY